MRLLNIGWYQAALYPRIPWHHSLIVALAIIALLATTLFIAAASPETIAYRTEELGAKADGFWALEFNGERSYRWTQGVAHFDFPALDGATQIAVAVSLSAPQRPEAPPVAATITAGARTSMHFDITPEWRTYHLLIDTGETHWRTPSFKITTATWRAPRDARDLGILVSHLTASRLLPPPRAVIVERWLFLASLVALIALATRHIRPTGMVPLGALALLAGLALWAPARLVEWLPVNWWLVTALTILILLNEGVRRYHPEALERINRIGLSITVGVAWTLTSVTHLLMSRLTGAGITSLLIVTGLAIILSALAYRLMHAVIPRLQTFGRNAQIAWLLNALLLGVLATLVIPTFPPLWHVGEGSLGLLSAYALPQQEHSVWLLNAIQGTLWTADIISFGVLLISALLLVSAWQPRAQPFALGWHWYALPCVLVWSIALLAFWPGLISEDPINQWTQMLSNRYSDDQPAFHTLTMRVITLLWLSPAAVALVQIGAMALAFGLTLQELALLGVSKWVQAFLTALFALSPVNNMIVITVWKDIPYAIALLFLFWMLLRVWRTDGVWLRSWRALASIGVALAALALYRHNGAPTALLILPAFLIVGQRAHWRQIAGIGGIALALVLLVKVGVYRALDVVPAAPWFVRQTLIHQFGAFITDPNASISEDDRRLIERLKRGKNGWRRDYSCYQLNVLLYGDPLDYGYFDAHVVAFDAAWLRMAVNNPITLIRHQLCLTSLIWRIAQPDEAGGRLSTYPPATPEYITYLREFGERHARSQGLKPGISDSFRPASLLPEVRATLIPWLQALERPEWIWLTWRPALYLYLALFCVAAIALRHRSWRTAGLALPVAAQSMVWMLLLTVQDFRFQYPVYVVSLMMVGLLFVPSKCHPPALETKGDHRQATGAA